jgi:hypothetical protein
MNLKAQNKKYQRFGMNLVTTVRFQCQLKIQYCQVKV